MAYRTKTSGERKVLSRLQRTAIFVMIGLVSMWALGYLALRIASSRSDPFRGIVVWPAVEPVKEFSLVPNRTLAPRRRSFSIAVPDSTVPMCAVFEPLRALDFFLTGQHNYFISQSERETQMFGGRIHIGATADF